RAILLVVVADGRILRYADYRLPPPDMIFNRWVIAIGAALLALVIGYMGLRIIPGTWHSFRQRLANYRQETHDLRDFFITTTFIRFLLTAAAVVGALYLLLSAALYNA